ncbi:MAG: hypothetical protein FJ299_12220 [Planctomycetes bacterium]|nr:hypothetical protein [Planctomycetota bacterium]
MAEHRRRSAGRCLRVGLGLIGCAGIVSFAPPLVPGLFLAAASVSLIEAACLAWPGRARFPGVILDEISRKQSLTSTSTAVDPGARRSNGLRIEHGTICYGSPSQVSWRIPVSELRLIAESTDESGLSGDDWLLILATSKDGWTELAMDTEALDELGRQLADTLGATALETTLVGSRTFASNILWPADLAGRPAFVFEPFPKWQQWLTLGLRWNRQRFSVDALDALSRARS